MPWSARWDSAGGRLEYKEWGLAREECAVWRWQGCTIQCGGNMGSEGLLVREV